jgi:hypothetical protein
MDNLSILTRADYEEFLFFLYFGADAAPLTLCLRRAYRDFSRTLHGMGILKQKQELKSLAERYLYNACLNFKNRIK